MARPLAIIPTYIADQQGYDLAEQCVKTLIASAGRIADVLIVDDASPNTPLMDDFERRSMALGCEVVRKKQNEGFASTVNVGLQVCLDEGRDAILVNQDIEFVEQGWLEALGNTEAWVAGGLLVFPSGLIQHAGIFYSINSREFDHIYRFGPPNLPEALRQRVCPVTGALQLIRYEALALIGLYDEKFKMGWEDIDYCIRVFEAGKECVYEPECRAIHAERAVRGSKPDPKIADWQEESKVHLFKKWAGTDFGAYIPSMMEEGEGWR